MHLSEDTYLVTGAMGCLGSWVIRLLLEDECQVVAFDISEDDRRHQLIIHSEDRKRINYVKGDLTDPEQVMSAAEGVSRIIHLGALQVPFCRADRPMGAAVNVVGTVNVFDAALRHSIEHLVYASSVAVFGNAEDYESATIRPGDQRLPTTLYGIWKCANESTARIFETDYDLPSVGLIPHTIYGPGRDQGLTSQPTSAVLAAVRKQAFHIEYGGSLALQFAPDTARDFIQSSRLAPQGSEIHGLGGTVASITEFVQGIKEVTNFTEITHGEDSLPFPVAVDSASLKARLGTLSYTPLLESIDRTVRWFEEAALAGLPLPS
jgi:nucleoside-diphosphate-sugar epimerase